MIRHDFERELAAATGESLVTLRARGFDLEPLIDHDEPDDREPLVVDWDCYDRYLSTNFFAMPAHERRRAA